MKKTVIAIVFLFLMKPLIAQNNFEVPKDYKLETASDFSNHEQDVVKGVGWLLKSPVSNDKTKRKDVSAFLMKWLTGSPDVSIELTQEVVTFMDCSDCLLMFMGGWAKYAIETKDKDKLKGNLAGVESVIELYKNNKDAIGKNKSIEKYIKLQEKNKLEKYLKSKL